MGTLRPDGTAAVAHAHRRREPVPVAARNAAGHPVLGLQRTVGNRAVSALLSGGPGHGQGQTPAVSVQRQLSVSGPAADVAAMLKMLGPASGLQLQHDPKTGLVSVAGGAATARSAALAARLTAIIDDAKKKAQINLGRNQPGVYFGAFPDDMAAPVQQLRMDHFIALEKAVPGDGVAKLIHEITENYEAQAFPDQQADTLFGEMHKKALVAEDVVLAELQDSAGHARSGGRLNTYGTVVGTGSKKVIRSFEVHENSYIARDQLLDDPTSKIVAVKEVPRQEVKAFQFAGFSRTSNGLPRGLDPFLGQIKDLLVGDPTASVLIDTSADPASAKAAQSWGTALIEAIQGLITNVELASWQRFWESPVTGSDINRVAVRVIRPQL